MNGRLAFLSHLVICLAVAGVAFFAWMRGVPQAVWANDIAGWFGLAIGAVTLSAMLWLGLQAWRVSPSGHDEAVYTPAPDGSTLFRRIYGPDASWGHTSSLLCPSIGMLGTVVGLSQSLAKVGEPVQMIASAHTAFYSTGCGIVGMIVTMLLTHSLESGMRRAR